MAVLARTRWHPARLAGAGVLVALGCLLPLNARAQEQLRRTLAVTGVGEVAVETTIARLRLGVEVRGATAADVQAQVARQTTAVVDLLRSRQVERLQTTGIRLQPDYAFENRQRRLLGYVGTNSIAFQVPVAQAGDFIDAAIQAGATKIDGVSFLATEGAIAAAEQAALRDATAEARQQAEIVLDSLGLQASEIVRIAIQDSTEPPRPLLQNAALSATEAGTPVVGGQQVVRARVSLQIAY